MKTSGIRFRSGWALERRPVVVAEEEPAAPLWTPPAADVKPAVPTVPFDVQEAAQWLAIVVLAVVVARRRYRDA